MGAQVWGLITAFKKEIIPNSFFEATCLKLAVKEEFLEFFKKKNHFLSNLQKRK